MKRIFAMIVGVILSLSCDVASAQVPWPDDAQWISILKDGLPLQDDIGDAQGSRNVVSDPTHPVAYLYNDLTYLFFRIRLDDDPAGGGGKGFLEPFGWGMELDTDLDLSDYEWLVMVDGLSKTENVSLQENSVQRKLGDPGDRTESTPFTYTPIESYARILPADTQFNGDPDYFLDWYIPYANLKSVSGLTDDSPIRVVWGSSSSATSLSEHGADLVEGSDLYTMASDYMIPLGTTATTGTVMFVAGLDGAGDVTAIVAGDMVFVKVTDADQNHNTLSRQTVNVTLTTSSGDTETITLTETGDDAGVFTGYILSACGPAASDGILQVVSGSIAVTYTDAVDADGNTYQPRTDAAAVLSPDLSLEKTVDKGKARPGDTLVYTVVYQNVGSNDAHNIVIVDAVPTFTTYVSGSSTGGDTREYSHDGGVTFDASDTQPVTHVRWVINGPLAPAGVDSVRLEVTID